MLVNRPFSQWVKLSDTLNSHSKAAYHSDCLQAADILKATIENPNARIDVMQSTALKSKIEENKHILCQIVRAALFLGKQGLAFRGDVENVDSTKNPGNFLALLRRANSTNTTTDFVITRWRHTRAAIERSDKIYKPRPIISVVGIDDLPEATLKEKRKNLGEGEL